MYIQLTTPWDPGMNDPAGNTYPQMYITQMTDNRTAQNFGFLYEAGSFQSQTVTLNGQTTTANVWVKGPGMLTQTAVVSGADYQNAINAAPLITTDTAYQSIIRLLYEKLINAGYAGTVVSP